MNHGKFTTTGFQEPGVQLRTLLEFCQLGCIFSVPIHANVETVELITKAAICLHNYLQLTDNAFYMPSGFVDSENADSSLSPGDWRTIVQNDESGMVSLGHVGGNRYA